jgi:hypothetical protein
MPLKPENFFVSKNIFILLIASDRLISSIEKKLFVKEE